MGLDMYLYRVQREQVGYWRKANAIHAWFERKCGEGEPLDNCKEYYLNKEDLIELRDLCKKVLDSCTLVEADIQNGERLVGNTWMPIYEKGLKIKNPELAQELLPTQKGFLFGSLDYDEYYVEDLKQTIQQIDKILETTDFTKEEICYFAWW